MELYFNTCTYTCMNLDDATYMYYHDQTSINEEKKSLTFQQYWTHLVRNFSKQE